MFLSVLRHGPEHIRIKNRNTNKVSAQVVPEVTTARLAQFIEQHKTAEAKTYTDENSVYDRLPIPGQSTAPQASVSGNRPTQTAWSHFGSCWRGDMTAYAAIYHMITYIVMLTSLQATTT